MKRMVVVLTLTLFITLCLGNIYFVSRMHESIPGATGIPLIARCELIYFDSILQPVNTFVLACPRMDMFRLWPLPIQHPWFEDPWYENPDALNG
jgi:hypothetical protein